MDKHERRCRDEGISRATVKGDSRTGAARQDRTVGATWLVRKECGRLPHLPKDTGPPF